MSYGYQAQHTTSGRTPSTSALFPLCSNTTFTDTISAIEGFQIQGGYCFGVSSWDKSARAYFVQGPQSITLGAEQHISQPITAMCPVGNMFVVGTASGSLGLWDLQKNAISPIHQFNDAIVSIKYIEAMQGLVVASLDGNLGLYDIRGGKMNGTNIGGKILQMDALDELIAYTTPGKMEVYNIQANKNETATRLGTLTNVSNCVHSISLFPDKTGLIYGSNDGRVNVCTFGTKDNKRTYAFKAQHKKITQTQSHYFPVNAVSFYNQTNVFLTAGSDGNINVWDKVKKSLVNSISTPIPNTSITTAKFICNGAFLAFSVGNDYHRGASSLMTPCENVPVIKIVDEPLVKS